MPSLRERLTDGIRYWEPRRILYNVVLAAIVMFYFAVSYPASRRALSLDEILLVFLMAVLANVAYCAAYVPDVFAQSSGLSESWRKYRWIVLAIGLVFAGIITRFISIAMFSGQQ